MKKIKFGLKSYVLSLLIDQLFAFMAAILITTIVGLLPDTFSLLRFILSVAIYAGICYGDSWKRGSSDRNRIILGEIRKNYFRGFLAGMIASIPGFILAVFAFLAETNVISVYDAIGMDIFSLLNRMWYNPLGALYDAYVNTTPAINLLIPLFMPIVAGIGYFLGLKDVALKNYFIYRNKSTSDESDEDDEDDDE